MIINRVAEHAGHDAPQQRTLESSDVSVKVENYATEMGIDTLGSMADAFRHESYTPLDGKAAAEGVTRGDCVVSRSRRPAVHCVTTQYVSRTYRTA